MNQSRAFALLLMFVAATITFFVDTSAVRGQSNNNEQSAEKTGDYTDQTDRTGASGAGTIDNLGLVAMCSVIVAGLTIAIGSIGPALGEGRAVAQALSSIAQQPDSSNTITRTLFVGLAMIESTAIYCFVVAMILLFANPFWNYFIK